MVSVSSFSQVMKVTAENNSINLLDAVLYTQFKLVNCTGAEDVVSAIVETHTCFHMCITCSELACNMYIS